MAAAPAFPPCRLSCQTRCSATTAVIRVGCAVVLTTGVTHHERVAADEIVPTRSIRPGRRRRPAPCLGARGARRDDRAAAPGRWSAAGELRARDGGAPGAGSL